MCVYVGNHCIHDVILWLIWGFKVFVRLTQCDACEQQMWTWDGRVNRNTHCRTLNSTGHADTHTHWEAEARPHVGIGGCRDAQKEVNAQDVH